MHQEPSLKIGKSYKARFRVKCRCGTEKVVLAQNLRNGTTISCGCYSRSRSRTHGMRSSPEYESWRSMWKRCGNPKHQAFDRYGGAGITVCPAWKTFETFYADMGPRPNGYTLERKDNGKGYNPDNCVWADWNTQAKNRRNTRILEFQGQRQSISEWSKALGIPRSAIKSRLSLGWSVDRALSAPVKPLAKKYLVSA